MGKARKMEKIEKDITVLSLYLPLIQPPRLLFLVLAAFTHSWALSSRPTPASVSLLDSARAVAPEPPSATAPLSFSVKGQIDP